MVQLSPKELLRCVCALKSWNALISSEAFCKAYLKRSLETNNYRTLVMAEMPKEDGDEWEEEREKYPTEFLSAAFYPRDAFSSARSIVQPLRRTERVRTEIVGCYDGLVCMHNKHYAHTPQDLAVWNPSIQRFRQIPFSPIEVPAAAKCGSWVKYGFGYDPSQNDYKVVRIYEFQNDQEAPAGSEVKVYSLKSNTWKKIESFSCTWSSDQATPLNGALHWFGKSEPLSDGLWVLALDLASEVFKEFRAPFEMEGSMDLEVVYGKLCMCVFQNDFVQHDIWVMKEYGNSESWDHLYTLSNMEGLVDWTFEYLTPLAVSRTGKGILMLDDSNSSDGNLFWYDPVKNAGKAVQTPGMPEAFTAVVCVANMRLLDGDPVIVPKRQQVLSIQRNIGSSEGEGSTEVTEQAKQGDLT